MPGHPARKLADRLHLLRLPQLFLQVAPLGDVGDLLQAALYCRNQACQVLLEDKIPYPQFKQFYGLSSPMLPETRITGRPGVRDWIRAKVSWKLSLGTL